MSPEILLTMLGIVLAIFAIVPRDRLLHWRLRITTGTVATILIAVLLLHYITYAPVFEGVGFFPNLGPYRWGFTPELTSYFIFVIALCILWWSIVVSRVSSRKLPLLAELIDRLIGERKHADLFALIRKHFRNVATYSGDSSINEGLRDYAVRIIRRVSTMHDVAKELATSDPYLGLDILNAEGLYADDFLRLYIWSLLDFRASVLYYEIRHNQNSGGGGQGFYRYAIPADNKLISELFGDAHRAEKLGIYKPVGDYGLKFLRERGIILARDEYNLKPVYYTEYGKWSCPLHAAIRLFDIMVLEALHQNVKWHMWLYYLPVFVEAIEENMKIYEDSEVDFDVEWPTPYFYLVYQIFDALRHFIDESTFLPGDQENISLDGDGAAHENDNIPKSAALAIGQGLRAVLGSEKITPRFKSYILEMPLRQIRELREKERGGLATVLARSVLGAGPSRFGTGTEYYAELTVAIRRVDYMLRFDLREDPVLKDLIEEVGVGP